MKWLINLVSGGLFGSIESLVKTIWGDKEAKDRQVADDQVALRNQFAAEFLNNRTAWDSFVNGLNRIVRPCFTFGTLALFIWCAHDPVAFTVAMTALQAVPDPLWIILGTIVVFWFGGKTLEGIRAPKVALSTTKAILDQVKATRALSPGISEEEYNRQMADESKPLSLPAIEEWNRRRKLGSM